MFTFCDFSPQWELFLSKLRGATPSCPVGISLSVLGVQTVCQSFTKDKEHVSLVLIEKLNSDGMVLF